MMRFWQRLSTRERSLVGLTFVIVLLVLARFFLLAPFLARQERVKEQLEIQPQLLDKNLRYIGRKAELAASLEKARAELKAFEPSLLSGDTPSVSASDLQQTVQGLAAKEGVQVITTRVLNPETKGPFTKIPIQMEVGGQIDQVASLIRGIDSAPKLLVVDEMNVRSLFRPVAAPQQPGAPAAEQNLRVSLTISGLARSQTADPSKGDISSDKAKSERGKAPGKSAPGP